MHAHEFFGKVQHKASLGSLDDAMHATRAALETLAERIGPDEARHLGAQLPSELRHYLNPPVEGPLRFTSDEYLERVSAREGVDLPASVHHARAVLDVLQEAVSAGEIGDVLERLPNDYKRLFAGSEGKLRPS